MRRISRFGLFENKRQLASDNSCSAIESSALGNPKQECQLPGYLSTGTTTSASIPGTGVTSGSRAASTPIFGDLGQTPDPRTAKRPRHKFASSDYGTESLIRERHDTDIDNTNALAASDRSDSDDETDTLEALLSSNYAKSNGNAKIDMIWNMYEKKRRIYKKYKERSDKTQEEMHRLTKILLHLVNMEEGQGSVQSMPQSEKVQHNPAARRRASFQHETPPLALPPTTATAKTTNLQLGCLSSDNEPMRSPFVAPNKNTSRYSGILSADKPVRAFQFSTQAIKAFQFKPRAATVCAFDGISGQTAAAYGFDGTVQFWDPSTRKHLLSITKDDLRMDLADQISQLTPSLIAVLAGGSTKGLFYHNKGSVALLSKVRQNALKFGSPAHITNSPHNGEISVVEGMPACSRNDNNTALMLSGGEFDKSVYMWAIGLSGHGAAVDIKQTQKMKTQHTTRITALCYEPFRGYAISGADGIGRINVNNTETGGLVVDNDHRLCGGGIGSMSICPIDSNLVMACCAAKGKQVQIFDLRQSMSTLKPALSLGKDEGVRNSRYIRSAWHPGGRLIFCPLNEEGTRASGSGTVYIWDVRYVRCQEEEPQTLNPHNGPIWSACFAQPSQNADSDKPILVTVSSDHNIAFTNFSI